MKRCTKCKEEYPATLEYFFKKLNGITSQCKKCYKKHCLANKEYIAARGKKYRELHKAELKIQKQQWRLKHYERVRQQEKDWAENNKEQRKNIDKTYRLNNKEKIVEKARNYRIINYKKIYETRKKGRLRENELARERRKTDPKFKLNRSISNCIYQTLKGKKLNRHWETIVGFTLQQLIKHIENLFLPGMSWDNHGKWHIDHSIPISVFNFTKPEHTDFKKCWSLENLRPMWAKANLLKGAKLTQHFQPSLLI